MPTIVVAIWTASASPQESFSGRMVAFARSSVASTGLGTTSMTTTTTTMLTRAGLD